MQDISNLNSIFSDVQALQSKLKSRLGDMEQNADKFKAALHAAAKPEVKAELVSAIKDKAKAALNSDRQTSDLASQIQATLIALRDQIQPQVAAAPVPVIAVATTSAPNNSATAATAATATATVAATTGISDVSSNDTVAAKSASATATSSASAPVAAPPAVPVTSIAAVNPTHAAYRVYDPANPSAFASPSNPGGGPNLLAADLVFNPDPRPDSVNSLKRPTAEIGSAEWGTQLKNYEVAYEKLSKDNNDWNQKNITIRNQTLLASPYAAFVGTQGVNQAALTDPYYLAYKADPSKAPG